MLYRKYRELINKEDFKIKYGISESQLNCCGLTWSELGQIYDDYKTNRIPQYREISRDFIDEFLPDEIYEENGGVRIHSIRSRIKSPEHLIEKIVRRKEENYKKYKELDAKNYELFVTDLIGIRCFVLFKADWQSVHKYLIKKIRNDPDLYVKSPIHDPVYDDKVYFAERPKAHIRAGDSREIYEELLEPDAVIDRRIYRSVHYIVRYKGVFLEIQVRTLFEEGWGEVDHAIVYPYYKDDPFLKEYTELLNRLSGLADEMGSFFRRAKALEADYLRYSHDGDNMDEKNKCAEKQSGIKDDTNEDEKSSINHTLEDCIVAVAKE